jgi:transcriptional regulator with XRE-family HTH domain
MLAIHDETARLDMKMFAELLLSTRKERNMTQTQLADMRGVNPRVYHRWERGTAVPPLDTIVKSPII